MPLADAAKSSRKTARARHTDRWLFGNWTATSAAVHDEQPPLDDAYADFMGKQVDNAEEFEEDTL
jgi:hypothetical protein